MGGAARSRYAGDVVPPWRRKLPTPNLDSSFIVKTLRLVSLVALLSAAGLASPLLAQKNDWTLSFPENKAHFVKVQLSWAKKNPDWSPTKEELEALFDRLDKDKDGQLTEEEWEARKGGKPEKKKKK